MIYIAYSFILVVVTNIFVLTYILQRERCFILCFTVIIFALTVFLYQSPQVKVACITFMFVYCT